ncbi:arsenate reductase/protein-tyrosine-phosphatase family protein [Chitinimonas prasina]|uniref:arsenate reductase/protein-tyrosine-phosphatase family protein n=1 Tax=Chitinimonas prasina TaxID=1434937 RepID=UPI0024E05A0E|nr:hypothetical protein [Chitinimonas prasina]
MRKLIAFAIFALQSSISFGAGTAEPSPKKITFVCEYGVAKSVIAEKYFNKLAKEQGLKYTAVSRGVTSKAELQPATAVGLKEDGMDTSAFVPENLSEADAETSERVVLIGIEQAPGFLNKEKVVAWEGVPSVSKSYVAVREDMIARIKQLIAELPK